MRVTVITQDDPFVIPANVEKIVHLPGVQVCLLAVVDAPGSLKNRKSTFLRGFGVRQAVRMGWLMLRAKCLDLLDALFCYRLLRQKWSVRAAAKSHGVAFVRVRNPNEKAFLKRLEELKLDLIVSLSAPCKFSSDLLALPRHGCINLHCSLLPRYAGLMPSFWVLFHGESATGATVHYMRHKIDNGEILAQATVPIEPSVTICELIRQTKARGGDLITETIRKIQQGQIETRPNDESARSYFSWPTIAEMKEFRRRGGRSV